MAYPGSLPLDEVDLVLLRELADMGTPDSAAKAAGVAPSTARRRLTTLERRLDVPLFANGTGLSTAGRTLLNAGRRLLVAVAEAAAQTSGRAGCAGGRRLPTLRLAAFGGAWDDFADDLAVHLPGLLLELRTAEPAAGAVLFDRHAVDAIYAWFGPGADLATCRSALVLRVLDEPLWVALPATHPRAVDRRVSLANLATDSWIVGSTEQSWRLVHSVCGAAGYVPRIGRVAASTPAARALIGNGQGVALASPLTTPPSAGANLVVRPLIEAVTRGHVVAAGAAVGDGLARVLRTRLRASYVAKAARRNADYLAAADFPVRERDAPPDPASLAGLVGAIDPVEPGLCLDDVHLLQVIGRCGSLNRAAPVLLISQPTLSRQVQRLERRLGTALFVRSYRGTELSSVARRLLAAIADAESAFRHTLDALRGDRIEQR